MPAPEKAALRERILRRRDAIPEQERNRLGAPIVLSILGLPSYRRSRVVLAYASFGSELPTDNFLRRALEDNKTLLLPRVEQKKLQPYEVRDLRQDLVPGTWGIREPAPARCPAADPAAVDFVLVPGVAFDRRGGRLGYGGGFYDRLLRTCIPGDAPLVAGAFEAQIVARVPTGPHDVPVDVVVTERGAYRRADGGR